ncbi:hypothetical protein [Curvivirga sp.]|uniref:hypothetical protein n=1 Tax=Curvivirga sp. TaxID=2856848 RepID=UPI003B59F7E5
MMSNYTSTAGETAKAMAIAFLFAVVGILGLMAVTFKADFAQDEVAFVFPSSFSHQESFNAIITVDGTPISFGISENIIIAKFNNNKSAEEAFEQSKALLALNPKTPGICTPIL